MLKKNEGLCEKVEIKLATKSLNLMKTRKVARPSGVTSELLKVCYAPMKSLLCIKCSCWVYKKCSGIRKVLNQDSRFCRQEKFWFCW